MNPENQMEKLIEKARREWKENWTRVRPDLQPNHGLGGPRGRVQGFLRRRDAAMRRHEVLNPPDERQVVPGRNARSGRRGKPAQL